MTIRDVRLTNGVPFQLNYGVSPKSRPAGVREDAGRSAEQRGSALLGPRGRAAAVLGVQDDLADAHGLRGHLDALVLAAELQRLLQRELARRHDGLGHVR